MKNKELLAALENALDKHRELVNSVHFINGWHMWPDWWVDSTISWQTGFKARETYEESKSKESER